ncbi:hypothetical protein B0H16DRAFT_1445775 [Mycena metata]|uniref:NACHT domain-containing protein n=1 Tax=Mycena metata TaxID=1033252 RepID=A0AAD7KHD5_9AGAR|nr:hypothetical protein B0H16DRAFT_1445775 [Mycena metata]
MAEPTSGPPLKRRRYSAGEHPPSRTVDEDNIAALDDAIARCSDVLETYTQPKTWLTLPFPLIYPNLPSDRFAFTSPTLTPTFPFMPREYLAVVYTTFITMSIGQSSLFLHGMVGLGKSHILAALAILFRKQGHRVVFLPDCTQLLQNPERYMKSALLCAFSGPDDANTRRDIEYLTDLNSIQAWCNHAGKLLFIIDQFNALEVGDQRGNDVEKQRVRQFLLGTYIGHKTIRSSSANDSERFQGIKQNELLMFTQGLTELERESWLNHHASCLPAMTPEEIESFFDFTGGIPLLSKPLLEHPNRNQAFEEIWPVLIKHPIFVQVRVNINQFASRFDQNSAAHKSYLDGLNACLTGRSLLPINHKHIDHRFCRQVDEEGEISCGVARLAIFDLLRRYQPQLARSPDWLAAMSRMSSNRSVFGFMLEQGVLDVLAANGLAETGNELRWDAVDDRNVIRFDGRTLNSLLAALPLNMTGTHTYMCLPDASNFEDVDGVHLTVNTNTKKAHIIPIQVSIAKRHKKSHELFYAKWDLWIQRFQGYSLSTAFLWVKEIGAQEKADVAATVHTTRARKEKALSPAYNIVRISIAQAAPIIAQTLERAGIKLKDL